jgi:hypothetical protein
MDYMALYPRRKDSSKPLLCIVSLICKNMGNKFLEQEVNAMEQILLEKLTEII